MKSAHKEVNTSLKLFIGWVSGSFLFGFVVIGELVWIIGSILYGDFIVQVDTNIFFGAIFAAIGFIPAIISTSGIINVTNKRIARIIFYIFLVIISLYSIFWGAVEYEEIITYGDKIVEVYPWSIFIFYILTVSGAHYVMRYLIREMGKQDNSEAELEFVLVALLLAIIVVASIFDIYEFFK